MVPTTSLRQGMVQQALLLDQLPEIILQRILDHTMVRDSPFYISDPYPGLYRKPDRFPIGYQPTSPTGATDPKFTGCKITYKTVIPQHNRSLQPIHRQDWISINSTSRRIRALGKISFFRMKTFAIHVDHPARFQQGSESGIQRKGDMLPGDQALALLHMRNIIFVGVRDSTPSDLLVIPKAIKMFSCIKRCTLLFGFVVHHGVGAGGDEDPAKTSSTEVEWITAATVLSGPVSIELRGLMDGIGIPEDVILEEAMVPEHRDWAVHRTMLETYTWPTLRIRGQLLRARDERQGGGGSKAELV